MPHEEDRFRARSSFSESTPTVIGVCFLVVSAAVAAGSFLVNQNTERLPASSPLNKVRVPASCLPDPVGNDEKRNDFPFRHPREGGGPGASRVFQRTTGQNDDIRLVGTSAHRSSAEAATKGSQFHEKESGVGGRKEPKPHRSEKERESGMTPVIEDPTETVPASENTEERKPTSELQRRVADWRYEGYLKSSRNARAFIRRMETPRRIVPVSEGETLEGVSVEKILPDKIVVSLGEEEQEIYLTDRPVFDLTDVTVPSELAEDPEALVASLFAQTLGRYMADQPDVDLSGENTEEADRATLEALSQATGWSPPAEGETLEGWVGQIADQVREEVEWGSGSRGEGPSTLRLAEEERLRILGLGPTQAVPQTEQKE